MASKVVPFAVAPPRRPFSQTGQVLRCRVRVRSVAQRGSPIRCCPGRARPERPAGGHGCNWARRTRARCPTRPAATPGGCQRSRRRRTSRRRSREADPSPERGGRRWRGCAPASGGRTSSAYRFSTTGRTSQSSYQSKPSPYSGVRAARIDRRRRSTSGLVPATSANRVVIQWLWSADTIGSKASG
jgi:hypothetical protein